jgi:hypothetical protein
MFMFFQFFIKGYIDKFQDIYNVINQNLSNYIGGICINIYH